MPPSASAVDQTKVPLHLMMRMFQRGNTMFSVIGFDGRFLYASPAWTDTFGWSRDELLEKPFMELVHPDDVAMTEQEAEALTAEQHDTSRFTNRYRTKDGRYRWLRWDGVSDPEMELYFAICQDVSPEVRAQERLARLEEEFIDFTYMACHDMRGPLTTARLQLELFEKGDNDEEHLEHAKNAIDAVAALTESMRRYAVIEHEADRSVVDLNEVLPLVEEALERPLEKTGARIEAERLPIVCINPGHAQHLLLNLIENSLKYAGKEPPRIRIESAGHGEGMARILYKDNGRGIDESEWERIFRSGYRGTSSQDHQGSGIGLAICSRVVERSGGSIRVLASSSAGTTFEILLPTEADS